MFQEFEKQKNIIIIYRLERLWKASISFIHEKKKKNNEHSSFNNIL